MRHVPNLSRSKAVADMSRGGCGVSAVRRRLLSPDIRGCGGRAQQGQRLAEEKSTE